MSTLTVTAKGQVTLKKEILQHLNVRPGDKITVNPLANGRVEILATPTRTGKISDIFGSVKTDITLSIEDMNDIIANAWAGKI